MDVERALINVIVQRYTLDTKNPLSHTAFGERAFPHHGDSAGATWRKIRGGRRRLNVEEAELAARALGVRLDHLLFDALQILAHQNRS